MPLVAPVAANAAMGGAIPLTTSLRPDLRSATVRNVNTTDVTTTVRFCFNKGIASLPQAGSLIIGTYRQAQVGADTATRASDNNMCADAVYSSTDVDVTQHTYGTALDDAVRNLANGRGNVSDSTALVQLTGTSATNNGTAGKTTAPDLTGITAVNSTDTINFIFDQNVRAGSAVAARFRFNDRDGNVATGTAATIAANVVAVRFPVGSASTPSVANAVRAFVDPAAVQARATGNDANGARLSATRPGGSGFTTRPDLQSATLAADGTTVDFVFDETIAGTPAPANFVVTRSDTGAVAASSVMIVNNNTVRAVIPNGASQNEYFVIADVASAAVTSATSGLTSTAGGLPVGGNAGAFATGFTTGPEALRVSFDNATGVASILLDQRFNASDNDFRLIDDSGTQLAVTPINISGSGGAAGQATVRVSFTPAELRGARSIQIVPPNSLKTFIGVDNVVQALSPTATAAVLSKGSKAKFRKATGLKKTKQLRAVLQSRK